MKTRMPQLILVTSLALCPLAASAQRSSTPLSPNRIKSSGLMVLTKDKQSKERITVAAKRMNVDYHALESNIALLATPDLTVTNVGQSHDLQSGKVVHLVVVENVGKAGADPCILRFMYGMTWDALENIDLEVPAIPFGKSAKIMFTPPDKLVHWWLFGVDVDNKLGEANFSNNLYVIEFKASQK